jgi:hypothetical protein
MTIKLKNIFLRISIDNGYHSGLSPLDIRYIVIKLARKTNSNQISLLILIVEARELPIAAGS